MHRNPNCSCSKCGKQIYRKPKDIERFENVFCSRICYGLFHRKNNICKICNKVFYGKNRVDYCSRICSNKSRTGIKYTLKHQNKTILNLNLLKQTFNFTTCMVENCQYSKCFDIHRLIPGKHGGEYKIGNMYAICPNHHSEVHRNIIMLVKINDCLLKAIEI